MPEDLPGCLFPQTEFLSAEETFQRSYNPLKRVDGKG
jgi:hypothetical protein